jgi:hypothetical protein
MIGQKGKIINAEGRELTTAEVPSGIVHLIHRIIRSCLDVKVALNGSAGSMSLSESSSGTGAGSGSWPGSSLVAFFFFLVDAAFETAGVVFDFCHRQY